MKDTVKSLMESAVTPHMDSATKNRIAFSGLRSISEAAADIIRFTPQKVVVDKVGENYVMRYSANVERLMEEQNMKLSEAVELMVLDLKTVFSYLMRLLLIAIFLIYRHLYQVIQNSRLEECN